MLLLDGRMRQVTAWIPARGGSKGLPRKSLLDLGGRPVIAWTIEAALAIRSIDRVIVNTDDEEIRETALAHGAEVPFLRPAELARDDSCLGRVVEHQWTWMREHEGIVSPDIHIGMSPTFPFRRPGLVDTALRLAAERRDVVNVRGVLPLPGSPDNYWTADGEGGVRRFPTGVTTDGGDMAGGRFYQNLFSFNVVLDCRNHLFWSETTNKAVPIPLTPIEAIDLDDPQDLFLARLVLEQGLTPDREQAPHGEHR